MNDRASRSSAAAMVATLSQLFGGPNFMDILQPGWASLQANRGELQPVASP